VSALAVPWLAACAVLVVAGTAKQLRPDPTVGALRAARLPSSRPTVRALGAVEIGLGAAGALTGAPALAALVAASYLGFALFVAGALRRGGMVQSCGCFGSPDVPATRLHVVVNLLAATVAAGAALVGDAGLVDLDGGTDGALVVGLAAIAAFQVVVVLTTLPRARFAALADAGGRW
jgi:hypothetical protein